MCIHCHMIFNLQKYDASIFLSFYMVSKLYKHHSLQNMSLSWFQENLPCAFVLSKPSVLLGIAGLSLLLS